MQNRIGFVPIFFAVSFLPAVVQAQCILTGEPALIRAGGLAEPLGSVQLQCQGTPGQAINGSIQVGLDTRIGNRVTDTGVLPEVQLSIQAGTGWIPLNVPARLGANAAVFENLQLSYDALGRLWLRITGLRGEARPEVRAIFSPLATSALPVPTPFVVVGFARESLLSGFTSGLPRRTDPVPAAPTFSQLQQAGAGLVTARVTEAIASAFGGPADKGVRILVRFPDVPKEATVWVPDAVAGSNATPPTGSGQMGLGLNPGAWQSATPPSLLLARVDGANARGAGGQTAFTPQPGLNLLGSFARAALDDGVPYAVYEVLSANPAVSEYAEIPAFLALPLGWSGSLHLVKPSVQLAPLSTITGPTESAPVPRFAERLPVADCPVLGDCQAPYFPRIAFFLNGSPNAVSLAAGTVSPTQYAAVNRFSTVLPEWKVTVQYDNGSNWVRLLNDGGVGNLTVAFVYDARNLTPGVYRATLTAETTNSPVGLPDRMSFGVTLTVTPAVEPPKPEPPQPEPPEPKPVPPTLADVLNAANRIPGPLAPGSLVVLLGSGFSDRPEVLFSGLPARVIASAPEEILVEAPDGLPVDVPAVVRVAQDGVFSGAFQVDIEESAPAIFRALNSDGSLNTAGNPATTGDRLQIVVTGIRRVVEAVTVLLHDRTIEHPTRVEIEPAPPGADILSVVIPADLPAMSATVNVCGPPRNEKGPACAEPFEIWLRKP
jgi:uncharacterized protein (TIGR03437 family)